MKQDKFIKQLSKLVGFETLSGNVSENAKALDYVESILPPKTTIKRVKNKNAEILIAGNSKNMSPDAGYMAHIDVVAAKPEQFKLKIKGDKLYGRGVSDMKFSIPLGVELLRSLVNSKSKTTFSLTITTDEEIGGFDGGLYLAEKLKFRPKCLIVPDGGDNMTFVNKAKGVCQLVITATGAPAHASRPWMGKNALEPITKLATELIKIYGKNSVKENWNTTMNIGQIQGGISTNQVCPEATMKLDFRYPESDSINNITQTVTKIAKKIGPDFKIITASTGLPTFTDPQNKFVKMFLNAMESAYGKKIVITSTYGASDARHFAKYNIPVLMMKPMGGEIHSDTEWVSLSSTLKFYEGLKLFLAFFEHSV
jgi:succinyl-diaminopimelate desuccinylase